MSRHASMPQVASLLAIADEAPWWPAALRIPVQAGETEQSAAWRTITNDPEWFSHARAGCRAVIDRIFWDDIRARPAASAERQAWNQERSALTSERDALVVARAQLEAELDAARGEATEFAAQLAKAETHIDKFLKSRSWRVTAPLRMVRRLLWRPPRV
jgi:hypothetical protein